MSFTGLLCEGFKFFFTSTTRKDGDHVWSSVWYKNSVTKFFSSVTKFNQNALSESELLENIQTEVGRG